MANVLVQESSLQDIADAIRSKNGTENTYKPSQMADAIEAISGGGITPTGTINITENGTHDVTNYASANVDVPSSGGSTLGTKTITENGTYNASSDSLDGYSQVTVNVPTSEGSSIASGTYTPESNSKNASFTVPSGITNFVFYATDFNAGIADAGWHTVGGVWFNGVGQGFIRYNNANASAGSMTVTLNGTTLSITAPYNLRTEKTYLWYAW